MPGACRYTQMRTALVRVIKSEKPQYALSQKLPAFVKSFSKQEINSKQFSTHGSLVNSDYEVVVAVGRVSQQDGGSALAEVGGNRVVDCRPLVDDAQKFSRVSEAILEYRSLFFLHACLEPSLRIATKSQLAVVVDLDRGVVAQGQKLLGVGNLLFSGPAPLLIDCVANCVTALILRLTVSRAGHSPLARWAHPLPRCCCSLQNTRLDYGDV
jgi:hypothetical protein